jgi:hypothetical protein
MGQQPSLLDTEIRGKKAIGQLRVLVTRLVEQKPVIIQETCSSHLNPSCCRRSPETTAAIRSLSRSRQKMFSVCRRGIAFFASFHGDPGAHVLEPYLELQSSRLVEVIHDEDGTAFDHHRGRSTVESAKVCHSQDYLSRLGTRPFFEVQFVPQLVVIIERDIKTFALQARRIVITGYPAVRTGIAFHLVWFHIVSDATASAHGTGRFGINFRPDVGAGEALALHKRAVRSNLAAAAEGAEVLVFGTIPFEGAGLAYESSHVDWLFLHRLPILSSYGCNSKILLIDVKAK